MISPPKMTPKRALHVVLLLVLLVALPGCVTRSKVADAEVVSVDQLVLNPKGFDQKMVRVRAWISLHNEDYNLWGSSAAMDSYNTSSCVSLQNYTKYTKGSISDLDGKYVEVTGTFTADATKGQQVFRLNACSDLALALDETAPIVPVGK